MATDERTAGWAPPPSPVGAASPVRPADRVRSALRWWYRPLADPGTWVALGYLAVGALWSIVMFAGAVVSLTIAFSLFVVVIGVLLVVPAFGLISAMCSVERRRASWVGRDIASRTMATTTARGPFAPALTRLADAERWRQVAFCVVYVVVAPVLLALGVLPWSVVVGTLLGGGIDLMSIDVLAVLLAVAFAGVAPRITVAAAAANASLVAWFTGPDPTADLEQRVGELATQRDDVLAAVAAERRRIERNLHDGVQQQLVALGLDVAQASARLDDDPAEARRLLVAAREKVHASIGELRVIGRGLHPAVLDDRGLDAALSAIVASASIPITIDVGHGLGSGRRLSDDVAATAYYVVNEAVANVQKHARARSGSVAISIVADHLRIDVHDDGRGGADATRGTGLAGIRARVRAVDGDVVIDSPPGGPTTLVATIPVGAGAGEDDGG